MVFGLPPRDVWPIACTTQEPARSLLVVRQFLGWDEILGEPRVLFEHGQKLGLLLIGQQAESDRGDQVMAALGPCVDGLGWEHQKNYQKQTH
jgi:hypothetical protein